MPTVYPIRQCCGIREIYGIEDIGSDFNDAKDLLVSVLKKRYASTAFEDTMTGAYYIFSYTGAYKKQGEEFTKLLKDSNLGEVIVMGPRVNPNSNHQLYAGLWKVDENATKKWWKEAA